MKVLSIKTKIPKNKKEIADKNIHFRTISNTYASSVFVTKNNKSFEYISNTEKKKLGKYDRLVAIITKDNDSFILKFQKSMLASTIDYFWIVINPVLLKEYQISMSDYLRIGTQGFKVYKIKGLRNSSQISNEQIPYSSLKKGGAGKAFKSKSLDQVVPDRYFENFCRVCLEINDSVSNPFIAPCLCAGTMGYVHLQCFYSWVLSKLTLQLFDFYQLIFFDPIFCEACRFAIPDVFQFSNTKFKLISVLKSSQRYIVFEMPRTTMKNQRKLIVVSLDYLNVFKLTQNGEVLNSFDSLQSGVFRVKNQKIYLSNDLETFDTTVLVRKKIILENSDRIALINENSLIEIGINEKKSVCETLCSCFQQKEK